ncbi:TPA: hypothetical protein QCR48_005891 [Bacillus cereus]|nr:hypothetical protein [Bacillus cereus]
MSRYFLRVKQGTDKYINPWKISNIIENLASEYYKKYVLDQLSDKVLNINEHQIPIIFNSSFDLYQRYSKLRDFNVLDREDIESLYYLGDIIPMSPSIKITKLGLIFKVHRSIYKLLKKNDILMDRSKMLEYIDPNFNATPDINFDALKRYVDSLIIEGNDRLKNKCETVMKNAEESLKEFVEDSVNLGIIDSLDEQELDEYIKDPKNRNFYQRYYGEFYKTYRRYTRPIVAILDVESGDIDILAKEFIKEDLQQGNEHKIEVKELSKNSPTIISWVVGYIASSFIANVFINALDNKRTDIEEETSVEGDELVNPEVLRLREAMRQLQTVTVADEFNDKVIRIEDFKARRGLGSVNESIKRNVEDTFEKNEFLNSNIEITPVLEDENEDEDQ